MTDTKEILILYEKAKKNEQCVKTIENLFNFFSNIIAREMQKHGKPNHDYTYEAEEEWIINTLFQNFHKEDMKRLYKLVYECRKATKSSVYETIKQVIDND